MSQTSLWSRIAVTVLFVTLYAVFLIETAALFLEFGPSGLAMRLATLDAQNFIFFPIGGLLVLIAFWRPTVMLTDALGGNKFRYGILVLTAAVIVTIIASIITARAFSSSEARSMFEIAPEALIADQGGPNRAPVTEALGKLKILAGGEDGLRAYNARCDEDWLQFSTTANEEKLCFANGRMSSVAECCQAKAAFRTDLNVLHAGAPSNLSRIHGLALQVKVFFLLMLLGLGVFLARYRPGLQKLYGASFERVSFGLAAGGAVMLTWPLMNAAYLETMSLLTGAGASSAYTITAPLVALGFAIWTMLLVFFHLRSYPSQIEYAAKIGGFVAAAIGVFRYDDIIGYFTRTLGVGGSVVAIVVFAVAVGALISSVMMGVRPQDIDFGGGEDS